ncbi:MAG: transcriptional regulator NrdR [Oligoflexales bacterium]
MKCRQCGHLETRVLESRVQGDGLTTRRRRSCRRCDHRFTTYEREDDLTMQVRKRDGQLEPYYRTKALQSLQIACQKRPIRLEEMEHLMGRVEREVAKYGQVIDSRDLGEMMLKGLYDLDHVAYVRFASVYKDFKDLKEFRSILTLLQGRSGALLASSLEV